MPTATAFSKCARHHQTITTTPLVKRQTVFHHLTSPSFAPIQNSTSPVPPSMRKPFLTSPHGGDNAKASAKNRTETPQNTTTTIDFDHSISITSPVPTPRRIPRLLKSTPVRSSTLANGNGPIAGTKTSPMTTTVTLPHNNQAQNYQHSTTTSTPAPATTQSNGHYISINNQRTQNNHIITINHRNVENNTDTNNAKLKLLQHNTKADLLRSPVFRTPVNCKDDVFWVVLLIRDYAYLTITNTRECTSMQRCVHVCVPVSFVIPFVMMKEIWFLVSPTIRLLRIWWILFQMDEETNIYICNIRARGEL